MSNKPVFSVAHSSNKHVIFIYNKTNALDTLASVCTNACIEAVRDYMLDDINKGEEAVGYQWTRADGKIVKLICAVEDK